MGCNDGKFEAEKPNLEIIGNKIKKIIHGIFWLVVLMSLCLVLNAKLTFGQCGADGNQPCPTKNKKAKNKITQIKRKGTAKIKTQTENTSKVITNTQNKKTIKSSLPSNNKTVSGGVLNGKAENLVKPLYPGAGRAVHASGQVSVHVLIDKDGNVIFEEAVNGHPLLKQTAEQAALQSKFSPTILSGQKVKVSGVIVYNFTAP